MFAWMKRMFCKCNEKQDGKTLPLVAAGQKWVLAPSDGDPWEAKTYRPVTVLDVRNVWVRYDMGPGRFVTSA